MATTTIPTTTTTFLEVSRDLITANLNNDLNQLEMNSHFFFFFFNYF